jgi:hypothetical protein
MNLLREPLEAIDLDDVGVTADEVRKVKRRRIPDDLEETLQIAEATRGEQEAQRLNLDRDRLKFEQERAEKLDEREERLIALLSNQTELQRQQQRDNTMMQMKMMSIVEEMLRKLER